MPYRAHDTPKDLAVKSTDSRQTEIAGVRKTPEKTDYTTWYSYDWFATFSAVDIISSSVRFGL